MNNILVTGSSGQLGSINKKFLKEYPNYKFFFSDIEDLDITDYSSLVNFIQTK